MSHELLTVIVSYNRPDLLKRTVESYLDTITPPYRLIIADNASDQPTRKYLRQLPRGTATIALFDHNYYPGYAANFGWRLGLSQEKKNSKAHATLLHRSDNDVEYLPGWRDEVEARFADERLGQLGLRTDAEEGAIGAVGGNAVIRREVWDAGARYDEQGWTVTPFEDAILTSTIQQMGYSFARVQQPCVVHIGQASRHDPYYQQTFAVRGIHFESYGL